jgi:hypothetical protein
MRGRDPRLIGAAWLIAVVVAVLPWCGCRQEAPPPAEPPAASGPPAGFVDESTRLVSPDLELELVSVRGIVHPGYTDWACLLECRERGGCRADVKLEIRYRSGNEPRTLSIAGRLEGEQGQTMRIGRVQRPPVAVDRVELVTVAAVVAVVAGAPRPTPMQ